jgi:hypothetical protein
MASSRITYAPSPDATPEGELDALAGVYRFVIGRHAAKTAAAEGLRLRLEGGVDGPLMKEPDEDVDSPPMRNPKFGSFQVTSKEDSSS